MISWRYLAAGGGGSITESFEGDGGAKEMIIGVGSGQFYVDVV